MNDRRTIATQGAELSADFTTFPADESAGRSSGAQRRSFEPADPDPDAGYAAVREVDLSTLEPYVARPGARRRQRGPDLRVERRPVNQCFIGSCANGQLEDLQDRGRDAARPEGRVPACG